MASTAPGAGQRPVSYVSPPPVKELLPRFAAKYELAQQRQPSESWTYYDTFDWRLYRQGLCLRVQGRGKRRRLQLRKLQGPVLHRLGTERAPAFARDLPAGVFRNKLSKLLDVRTLLELVEITLECNAIRILDRRRKTVARVFRRSAQARSPAGAKRQPLSPRLEVEGVRGYGKARRDVVGFIEEELGLSPASQGTLEEALYAVGWKPASYSGKVEVELEAEQRADRAVKEILRQLLETMEVNQAGVIQDLDPEFLHDFRVAVRRTRSALAQIKGVFPKGRVRRFRREFSWLGKTTGIVRDLDVYLLKIPDYQGRLPASVREDLMPLRDYLRGRKRREHRKLVKALKSKRYRNLLKGWREFLAQPVPRTSRLPRATQPIGQVASDRIWRVYAKVIRKGGAIKAGSPAEKLHRLRIDCKKLRYLMEFFRSLYPPDELDRLLRELKRLQNNLGDFNDFAVQRETLKRMAAQRDAARRLPVETLMCIGRLLERLEAGQRKERSKFMRRFRAFSSPENAELFSRLFQARTSPEES